MAHGPTIGDCDWDDGDVTLNNKKNFNKNYNKNVNKGTGQANGWQHNPQHRGNAPYANKQTANKYGGTARGEVRQPTAGAGTRSAGGVPENPAAATMRIASTISKASASHGNTAGVADSEPLHRAGCQRSLAFAGGPNES